MKVTKTPGPVQDVQVGFIYSVSDIAKKLDITRQSAMKRIEKSDVKGMYEKQRRKRMFSEKEYQLIKSCSKCFATETQVIYITQTYLILESNMNKKARKYEKKQLKKVL